MTLFGTKWRSILQPITTHYHPAAFDNKAAVHQGGTQWQSESIYCYVKLSGINMQSASRDANVSICSTIFCMCIATIV